MNFFFLLSVLVLYARLGYNEVMPKISDKEAGRYEDALLVAVMAHRGQRRRSDGKPYITHPIAVSNSLSPEPSGMIVGLLHDVLEDCKLAYLRHNFLSVEWTEPSGAVDKEIQAQVHLTDEERHALVLLTKHTGAGTYFEYIERICKSKNSLAKRVKLADLQHNLSTLIGEHSLKDRYLQSIQRINKALV